jgi:hypothetical protein
MAKYSSNQRPKRKTNQSKKSKHRSTDSFIQAVRWSLADWQNVSSSGAKLLLGRAVDDTAVWADRFVKGWVLDGRPKVVTIHFQTIEESEIAKLIIHQAFVWYGFQAPSILVEVGR